MGGKKPAGSNPSRGGYSQASSHSSRVQARRLDPDEPDWFDSLLEGSPWLRSDTSIPTPLPFQTEQGNDTLVVGLGLDSKEDEEPKWPSWSVYSEEDRKVRMPSPPRALELSTSFSSKFESPVSLSRCYSHETRTSGWSPPRVSNEGLRERVRELESEVQSMKQSMAKMLKCLTEGRLNERVSTLEGRQSAAQSKIGILDSCFGPNSQAWSRSIKSLKTLMDSTKQHLQQQQQQQQQRHKRQQQHQEERGWGEQQTNQRVPSEFLSAQQGSFLPTQAVLSSSVGTIHSVNSPYAQVQVADGNQVPYIVSTLNFVTSEELNERLSKISSSINIKTKQMTSYIQVLRTYMYK